MEEVAGKAGAKDGLSGWVRQVKREESADQAVTETTGGDDLEVVEAEQDDLLDEAAVEGGAEKVASGNESGNPFFSDDDK